MKCRTCYSKKTDGRQFCRPRCFVEFKDGRERRPPAGINTFIVKGRDARTQGLSFCL